MRACHHLLLVLLAVSLGGCVMHRDVARSAVSFNLAVEQAQNEMLVLNVIRSSLRRPMYITGIQSVTGSLSTEVEAGLSIPIGKKKETNLSTLGGSYTDHPTFNVAVYDSKEFMRGFTTAIPPELLAYYWNQGWSGALLLHLLVEQIAVTLQDPVTGKVDSYVVFDNYPDAEDTVADESAGEPEDEPDKEGLCHHVRFALFVEAFVGRGADLKLEEKPDFIGPAWSETQIHTGGLAPLIAAHKEKLRLRFASNVYQLEAPKQEAGLDVPTGLKKEVEKIDRLLKCRKPPTRPGGAPEIEGTVQENPEQLFKPTKEVKVELFLRSPEAALYYLGELARVETQGRNTKVPTACIKGSIEPIFVVRQPGPGCRGGALETRYDGEPYVIPERGRERTIKCSAPGSLTSKSQTMELVPGLYRPPLDCDGGRTMQALSLVSEIIALQKSAEDLPAPSVLRTID